jgi:hypothetical protein
MILVTVLAPGIVGEDVHVGLQPRLQRAIERFVVFTVGLGDRPRRVAEAAGHQLRQRFLHHALGLATRAFGSELHAVGARLRARPIGAVEGAGLLHLEEPDVAAGIGLDGGNAGVAHLRLRPDIAIKDDDLVDLFQDRGEPQQFVVGVGADDDGIPQKLVIV